MDCGFYIISIVVMFAFVIIKANSEESARKAENKSKSTDYIYNKEEDTTVIAGSNLDRFFIECVLSGADDFTKEKNIARVKLLADKYNLSYPNGIEKLYEKAYEAHMKISNSIIQTKENDMRQKEKAEYDALIRYADYYGKEKKRVMLSDRMVELRKKAKSIDDVSTMMIRSTQQQESDWAVWGGIASGIAGTGAGVATALEMQANNSRIRAQNEANMRAAMPAYMFMSNNATDNRRNADAIQKEIENLNEKLIDERPSKDVMKLLEICNETIDVSTTGAYKITATAKAKESIFIYEDVPAVIDGTIIAHIYDGDVEIATTKIVLPVNGVSKPVGIIGTGLNGLAKNKNYSVKFSEYKLWLIEK